MTNDNPLLGRLLSAHKLGDFRGRGLIGCGVFLLVPFGCGIWTFIAALNDTTKSEDAVNACYGSIGVVVGSVVLFGLLLLLAKFFFPFWQGKSALEIYENGFVQRDPFKTQNCLWSEIREVNPMLLINSGAHRTLSPGSFFEAGEDEGKFRGIYEVYKQDGGKITVSRRYEEIERLDEVLIPFCPETPVWSENG